jgi:hypothetical protein
MAREALCLPTSVIAVFVHSRPVAAFTMASSWGNAASRSATVASGQRDPLRERCGDTIDGLLRRRLDAVGVPWSRIHSCRSR